MMPTQQHSPPSAGKTCRRHPWQRAAAWLLSLLVSALVANDLPAREIKLRDEPVVVLARSMASADELARWDFADTLLDALVETYQDELATALDEDIITPARKAKLARWQAATALLMEELVDARLLLSAGAPFDIQVDATDQVLLFVDGRAVAFSAPRPEKEQLMAGRLVRDYCARNDCAVLTQQTGPGLNPVRSSPPAGSWSLRQGQKPRFEIDRVLHCPFDDLGEREQKVAACTQAAADIDDLLQAAVTAERRGFRVDWTRLAEKRRATGMEVVIPFVDSDRFVRLGLRLITRLDEASWSELVRALGQNRDSEKHFPVVINGSSLIAATRR
ncbi:MAG: hypothetical protein KDI88_05185 [Gammaproteobacteria bacterium]|nr:hypothetical protein [Gammaproteobacteria bacterium]